MEQRPDPDKLLKHVQAEESLSHQGRLKLFFGASPGVGKTYAMLEAARQRKNEGWDVVVGLVETHGRADTEALVEGLEILPRKEVSYGGVVLKEFDLDGALKRRPRLILVDELAHTNAPGLRHAKRWQDIQELLEAGIDVYTTLNVQHWETLNDVVAKITNVVVRETVPDTFLRRAHDLELVDLAPEDLLKRMKDGKVYKGELAGQAVENFFRPGNLIALRELALRHAAERVDEQMRAFKDRNAIGEVWPIGERLLVGVSASPMSATLIRATSRLATRLKAPWLAVHVDTPAFLQLPQKERNRAIDNMRLAERLGAEVVTASGDNITDELIALAKSRNATHIVLGKPARARWKEWLFGSIVNEVARRSGNIDLHVISGIGDEVRDRPDAHSANSSDWTGLLPAMGMVAVATALCWPLARTVDRANLAMIYLLGVAFTAYRFSRRAAILSAVLSVASFDFFFVPPRFTFAVSDTEYLLTFGVMLVVGLMIASVTGRLRSQTVAVRERADRMRILYTLSRTLSETADIRGMLNAAQKILEDYCRAPILILTGNNVGRLEPMAGDRSSFGWNENEMSVARWAFDHGEMAGAGSDTLSGAQGLYLPLKGMRGTIGVLGIRSEDSKSLMAPDRLQLLESFASEIGGAVESTRMSEEIGRADVQAEQHAMEQAHPDRGMKLGEIVSEPRIKFFSNDATPAEIIRSLAGALELPNPKTALRAILDREKAGATRIGESVAIPHARIDGLDGIRAAIGISHHGPIHVWIVFVSPTNPVSTHLSFLANLAAFFQDRSHVTDLLGCHSPSEVLAYLQKSHQTR